MTKPALKTVKRSLLLAAICTGSACSSNSIPLEPAWKTGPQPIDYSECRYMYGKVVSVSEKLDETVLGIRGFDTEDKAFIYIQLTSDEIVTPQKIMENDYLLLAYDDYGISTMMFPPDYNTRAVFRISGSFDLEDSLNRNTDGWFDSMKGGEILPEHRVRTTEMIPAEELEKEELPVQQPD